MNKNSILHKNVIRICNDDDDNDEKLPLGALDKEKLKLFTGVYSLTLKGFNWYLSNRVVLRNFSSGASTLELNGRIPTHRKNHSVN